MNEREERIWRARIAAAASLLQAAAINLWHHTDNSQGQVAVAAAIAGWAADRLHRHVGVDEVAQALDALLQLKNALNIPKPEAQLLEEAFLLLQAAIAGINP